MINFIEETKIILKSFKLDSDDDESEEVKDAFTFLTTEMKKDKSTRVQRFNSLKFQRGKIYIFNYDPITKDKLWYWDTHPILLFFDIKQTKKGPVFMGINLSWYPIRARKFFLKSIKNLYKTQYKLSNIKPMDGVKQLPVNLDIKIFEKLYNKIGFSFAIRNYLPSRIKGPIYSICFEDWDKIEKLSKNSMFPQLKSNKALPDIYKEFKDHIIKKSKDI